MHPMISYTSVRLYDSVILGYFADTPPPKEMALQHSAPAVINGQMIFLDTVGLRFRHFDSHIHQLCQLAAVSTSQSNHRNTHGFGRNHRMKDILTVSRCGNSKKDISRPALAKQLLGKNTQAIHIIHISGSQCFVGHQGNGHQGAFQIFCKSNPPHRINAF